MSKMQQISEGTSQSDRLIVAAIDFGTTYSGYAFSFQHEFEMNPLKMHTYQSNDQGVLSWKIPTTVLLHPDQSFHSFGYTAEVTYHDLADQEEHADWYYFKRFKMLLHGKLNILRKAMITDATGKKMSAMKIFAVAIDYLRGHLLETIATRGINIRNTDINWVLTVPAIWEEPAKQFMREAAVQGGIPSDQLKLALEPEAASVYCKTVPLERNQDQLGPFSPETIYMVLDCGGGTVDVTVHEVARDGRLKEIHRASGGAWGGTKVDSAYMDLMAEMFGSETMNTFQLEYKVEHLEMLRDFELKKRTIGQRHEGSSGITILVSVTLSDHVQETRQCTLKQAIETSSLSGKVKLRRGNRLTIPDDIIRGMFSTSINSITEHVREILKHSKVKRLDKILMVGGFSESPLVRTAVKEAFPDVLVVAPDDPGLAVLRGAVIYGHQPSVISSRVVPYTYGVAVTTKFDEAIHPEENRLDEIYCRDVFSKFFTIDADIGVDSVCSKSYPILDCNRPIGIDIVVSTLPDPVVTNVDCTKLGSVLVKCPIGGWRSNAELQVEFKFGDTEFSVRAVEKYTQVEQEASFDFLQ